MIKTYTTGWWNLLLLQVKYKNNWPKYANKKQLRLKTPAFTMLFLSKHFCSSSILLKIHATNWEWQTGGVQSTRQSSNHKHLFRSDNSPERLWGPDIKRIRETERCKQRDGKETPTQTGRTKRLQPSPIPPKKDKEEQGGGEGEVCHRWTVTETWLFIDFSTEGKRQAVMQDYYL